MIQIDTNVLLRYIMGDRPDQAQGARQVIERIERGNEQGIIVHNVIHEATYILTSSTPRVGYNLAHVEARNRLVPIIRLDSIEVLPDKWLALEALLLFSQSEKLDFTDALIITYVRNGIGDGIYSIITYIRNGIGDGIYSFDKGLDRVAGANRIDPRTAPSPIEAEQIDHDQKHS